MLAASANSSSVPSAIVLLTPGNSRKRTNHLLHQGLANSTRAPAGLFLSYDTRIADNSLRFLQWSSTRYLAILAPSGQNQHSSTVRTRIRFRITAECQYPFRNCAAIGATAFLALSCIDFSGGDGEISIAPCCAGPACHSSLGVLCSAFWPSLTSLPSPDCRWSHVEICCRGESSVVFVGWGLALAQPPAP